MVSDVRHPLLGADFLCTNGLMVNLKGHRLIDTTNYAITPLNHGTLVGQLIRTVVDGAFTDLLKDFPLITTPNFSSGIVKHGVQHFVLTHGPPLSARARHLPPYKLKLA